MRVFINDELPHPELQEEFNSKFQLMKAKVPVHVYSVLSDGVFRFDYDRNIISMTGLGDFAIDALLQPATNQKVRNAIDELFGEEWQLQIVRPVREVIKKDSGSSYVDDDDEIPI